MNKKLNLRSYSTIIVITNGAKWNDKFASWGEKVETWRDSNEAETTTLVSEAEIISEEKEEKNFEIGLDFTKLDHFARWTTQRSIIGVK